MKRTQVFLPDQLIEKLEQQAEEKGIPKGEIIRRAPEEYFEKEAGLPPLMGSEKQVAWAETLRHKMLKTFENAGQDPLIQQKRMYHQFMDAVRRETRAKWWIDNRFDILLGSRFLDLMESYLEEITPKLQIEKENSDPLVIDAKTEATVRPENAITTAAAEIRVQSDKIMVLFEKNDTFRNIVKALKYNWSGSVWERELDEFTGTAYDRAAELGNKLLNAGIPVMIMDEQIRNAAIKGEYEPECDRWVLKVKGEEKLKIKWWEKNDRLYQVARKLPGSKWDRGVIVSLSHFKEVEEFAGMYGFNFTEEARAAIEVEKVRLESIERVKPAEIVESEAADGLKKILESPADVLEDLKD